MEIRRINKFNNGSMFILIPKNIIKDQGIKKGDYYIFSKGDNNTIMIERVIHE